MEPDNTWHIYVGNDAAVRENVCGIIDCTLKEQEMKNISSELHPTVTWYKNEKTENDTVSHNRLQCVYGEIGRTDNYTCQVCVYGNICTKSTSLITVCGE